MQSLRTRKPSTQPRSKAPQRPQVKLAKAPTRSARKSRVDDKIKKRMSMRYADISSPTGVSGVPDVPSVPIDVGLSTLREQDETVSDRSAAVEDPRAADRKFLDQENFDPDAYLKIKLANSTEAELRSLQSSLRSMKDETHSDLQRNVFKNYAEFVLISKEIGSLENEMLELKESLAEWKSMPSLLHIDDTASVAERRRNARSSVADLRILYANQMQTLHAQIEGSSKFAPTTPGRHVVIEMDGIFALNAATYKIDHSVRIVVLDDAVLVARRRRRRNVGGEDINSSRVAQGKLIAERCWPLNEMLVLDTKDTASITNVFKIRHGKETHVYRTEVPADKKSLLSQFRQVAEELAARKRKEREGEHERRKTLWAGDRNSLAVDKVPTIPEWMIDLNQRAGNEGSSAKEKAERDSRWVGEWSDELTVAIALREWEKAVTLVEKGKTNASTMPLLATKLPNQITSLTDALLRSLSSPTNRKSAVVNLISWLVRLEAGPAARNTFFKARTDVIQKYVRAIRFEGHIGVFIGDLAIVVFTGIKHTADWFLASFKENEVASSFIEWAKKQIEYYAETFRKQVYSSDVDQKTVEDALKITHSQSKKLLQEYGLDFRFLLDNLLTKNPKEARVSDPPFSAQGQMHRPDPIVPPGPSSASLSSLLSPPPPNSSTRLGTPSSAIPQGRLLSPAVTPGPITSRFRSPVPTPLTAQGAQSPSAFGLSSAPLRSATRTPLSAAPPVTPALPTSPRQQIVSPAPRRPRSPPPTTISYRSDNSLPGSVVRGPRPSRPPSNSPVPRTLSESPAPPPRSTNRPGSSHRPPPVAIPKREGMF